MPIVFTRPFFQALQANGITATKFRFLNSTSRLAVVSDDGNVYCAGSIGVTDVGPGAIDPTYPTQTTIDSTNLPNGISSVAQYAANSTSAAVLDDTGNFYIRGANRYKIINDSLPRDVYVDWTLIDTGVSSFALNDSSPAVAYIKNGSLYATRSYLPGDDFSVNIRLLDTDVTEVQYPTSTILLWRTTANQVFMIGNGWSSDITGTIQSPRLLASNAISFGGSYFSFGYKSTNGNYYVTGYNAYGQLNTGDTTSYPYGDTFVSIGSSWKSANFGTYTGYFINNSDQLYAVGYNINGELGNGTTTNSSSPEFVASNVTELYTHPNGALYKTGSSWFIIGRNNYGFHNDGTTDNSTVESVIGGSEVVSASVTQHIVSLVTGSSTVKFTGYDYNGGALGKSAAVTYAYNEGDYFTINGQQLFGSNIVDIVSSQGSTIALCVNGNVYGVGTNTYGQLGVGHANAVTNWTLVDTNVDEIYAFHSHMLAVRKGNSLYGAGRNYSYRFNTGNTNDTISTWTYLFSVTTYPRFTFTSGGGIRVTSSGTMQAIGNFGNATYALKFGQNGPSSTMTTWTSVGITDAKDVATTTDGYSVIYTDTSNNIKIIGMDTYGLAGANATYRNSGATITASDDGYFISSDKHGLVTTNSVAVHTASNPNSVTLCDTSIRYRLAAGEIREVPTSATFGYELNSVMGGSDYQSFRMGTDRLYHMHVPYTISSRTKRFINNRLRYFTTGSENYPLVHVGTNTVDGLALINNSGLLYRLYGNIDGSMGNNTLTEPTSFSTLSNVKFAAFSRFSSYYVNTGNNLYSAGRDTNGELGTGTSTTYAVYTLAASNVAKVYAGSNHAYYLSTSNQIYGTGSGINGRLAHVGDRTTFGFITSNIVEFDLYEDVAIAVTSSGNVVGWGDNDSNSLGVTPSRYVDYVHTVYSGGDAIQCASSNYSTIFLTSSGNLYSNGRIMTSSADQSFYPNNEAAVNSLVDTGVTEIIGRTASAFYYKKGSTTYQLSTGYYSNITNSLLEVSDSLTDNSSVFGSNITKDGSMQAMYNGFAYIDSTTNKPMVYNIMSRAVVGAPLTSSRPIHDPNYFDEPKELILPPES